MSAAGHGMADLLGGLAGNLSNLPMPVEFLRRNLDLVYDVYMSLDNSCVKI